MNKDILIEVYKAKSCDNSGEVTPKVYSNSYAFDFFYNNQLVDIRIFKENIKYYIKYETISFEISKFEYDELFLLYDMKKKHMDMIEEEKKIQTHNKNKDSIMEMYQKSIRNKREVLIEKKL